MLPMVAVASEFVGRANWSSVSSPTCAAMATEPRDAVRIGAMVEVPSLLYQLDGLLGLVDFLSVGSNDLLQFLYAADRGNPGLHPLRSAVAAIAAGAAHIAGRPRPRLPATVCGELASHPLAAMALSALGSVRSR